MSGRLARSMIVTAVATALLAGCAGSPAYAPDAADRLQQQVLAVSTSTAEADWATASTRLLELEASASTALARDEITQERFDAIMAAIALVRGDVDAAIAAAEAAAAEQAAADQAAAEAEAARVAAEEAARQADESNRGNGKGDDDDKGDKKDND